MIADYAPGGSLRDLLQRQSPLPMTEALTIMEQLGQALHHAHSLNIIHRDLKPENILFDAQGEVLLADFGIATILTASVKQSTTIVGTLFYMAPEQFRGMVSKEGDQYALGCIAYELLTGRRLFEAADFFAMGAQHLYEQPVPPSHWNAQIPPAMEAAVLKALSKQRTERHASVEAFVLALRGSFVQLAERVPTPSSPTVQPPLGPSSPETASRSNTKEEWLSVGTNHRKAKRYEEALAAYDQAIRLYPNNADAYNNKGNVLLYDQVICLVG